MRARTLAQTTLRSSTTTVSVPGFRQSIGPETPKDSPRKPAAVRRKPCVPPVLCARLCALEPAAPARRSAGHTPGTGCRARADARRGTASGSPGGYDTGRAVRGLGRVDGPLRISVCGAAGSRRLLGLPLGLARRMMTIKSASHPRRSCRPVSRLAGATQRVAAHAHPKPGTLPLSRAPPRHGSRG
jgi:hypothetical protein